jgi:hypothetical protein
LWVAIAVALTGLVSEAEVTEPRVNVGAATKRLEKMPLGFCDGVFVDAGEARSHQTVSVEAPVFVAIGAKPLPVVVVIFVGEPYRDTVSGKGPEFLRSGGSPAPAPTYGQGKP